MSDYIKQLEEQNEELKERLTKAESILYADGVRRTALEVFHMNALMLGLKK